MGTSDGARRPRLREWLKADPDLALRFERVRSFSHTVHASEYHLTNACNLRCKGCWFFVNDFDKATSEVRDLAALRSFVQRERERGVNAALLIGGEPTLVPNRVSVYVEEMTYVSISTNGLRPLPREGFENVGAGLGLQQNDVRCRCCVVGIDGGGNAAHVNRKEGLAETAVFARRAHRSGDRDAGAIGLYRYAWRRRDVFVGLRRCVVQLIV